MKANNSPTAVYKEITNNIKGLPLSALFSVRESLLQTEKKAASMDSS